MKGFIKDALLIGLVMRVSDIAVAAPPLIPGARALLYDIRSQSLQDSLEQFADQSGYQVLFRSQVAADALSPPLTGTFLPAVALDRLLASSGLRYEFINSHTLTIRSDVQARSHVAKAIPPLGVGAALAHIIK